MSTFIVRASQRRAIRKHVRLACRIVREHDFIEVGRQCLDVSPDGMRVPTKVEVREGEGMIVSFRADELGMWFDTDAVVTRVIEGRRPTDLGRSFGLRFGSLGAVSRLILRGYLRRYPPPLPQRDARIDYAATVGRILSIPPFG